MKMRTVLVSVFLFFCNGVQAQDLEGVSSRCQAQVICGHATATCTAELKMGRCGAISQAIKFCENQNTHQTTYICCDQDSNGIFTFTKLDAQQKCK